MTRLAVITMFLAVALPGCCGVGGGPSTDRVKAWLSESCCSTADDADRLLTSKGFSVSRGQHTLFATKTVSSCMFVQDRVIVDIRLDDHGKVQKAEVFATRVPP